jgi:RES domain
LERAKFLEALSQRITTPVMPDDEPLDYLATQAIADFLASEENHKLDGIIYPSVQGGKGKFNVVLFHEAARVQPLDLPKGVEISAKLYDHTEDGWEPDYWVWEAVPPKQPPAKPAADIDDFTLATEFLGVPGPEDSDLREAALKLDISSLKVHHVSSVEIRSEVHEVHRHRSEKRKPEF